MKRYIQELLELQKTDLRIRELEAKCKSYPSERAELVAEFNVVRDALAAAENKAKRLECDVHAMETDIAGKKAHLQEIKIRSGTIKKMSEYNTVMAEIGNLNLQISQMEDRELEKIEELEKARAEVEKAARSYRATGRTVQKEVRALDSLVEEVKAEIIVRKNESQERLKRVPLSILPLYQRLLATGKGEPIGSVRGGRCSNCSLSLPPMTLNEARKGNLVPCDNCSFLLYDPDGAD